VNCVNNGDKCCKLFIWLILFIPRKARLAAAHRVAAQLDAVGIVDKAVEDGVGIGRIAEHNAMPQ
jgi:hypothetical protein